MLVLTRKLNESIMIGDNVKVTVVDVKGDQVKLGITAPRQISVHREEVYLEILKENQLASQSVVTNLSELERAWKNR
ncbi:MAG TPA: carbon storage regulator CsrA [Firmicutes bacterium]|nr:carbon storage regulator CsrA [Bacillota bacterium]HOQ24289.1 carbon storage regulator CsrA [Bacillota bacterium]HPT66497.1 carbon storage regulator CsrA [Bacillota bacterium]